MNAKKNFLKVAALLAVTPALFAAEPAPPTMAAPGPAPATEPSFPEDLADQAGLVQQIGAEASRGFDVEAHARALRAQIEALVSGSAASAGSGANTNVNLTAQSSAKPVSASPAVTKLTAPAPLEPPAKPAPQNSAVQDAIRKMRAALEELETQLHR